MATNLIRNRAFMKWLDEALSNPFAFIFMTAFKLILPGIVLWAICGLIQHRSVVLALKALWEAVRLMGSQIGSPVVS